VNAGHCFSSFDDGKTWSTALDLDQPRNFDPYVTYGRGDTAFVTVMTWPWEETESMKTRTAVYRSVDGGKTFRPAAAAGFIDRESIVVDKTNGKYAGRVYLSGMISIPDYHGDGASSLHLFRSTDGGTTFLGPVQRATLDGGSLIGQSRSVVLSDGTLAFLTGHIKKGRNDNVLDPGQNDGSANVQLELLTSTDGGESLNPAITLGEMYMDRKTSEGVVMPELAVDPGSPFFKDRLYAVWPDAAA